MQAEAQSSDDARELVKEIDFLVAQHYFDARKAGFDAQTWHAVVQKALARPLPDTPAAYRSGTIRSSLDVCREEAALLWGLSA